MASAVCCESPGAAWCSTLPLESVSSSVSSPSKSSGIAQVPRCWGANREIDAIRDGERPDGLGSGVVAGDGIVDAGDGTASIAAAAVDGWRDLGVVDDAPGGFEAGFGVPTPGPGGRGLTKGTSVDVSTLAFLPWLVWEDGRVLCFLGFGVGDMTSHSVSISDSAISDTESESTADRPWNRLLVSTVSRPWCGGCLTLWHPLAISQLEPWATSCWTTVSNWSTLSAVIRWLDRRIWRLAMARADPVIQLRKLPAYTRVFSNQVLQHWVAYGLLKWWSRPLDVALESVIH